MSSVHKSVLNVANNIGGVMALKCKEVFRGDCLESDVYNSEEVELYCFFEHNLSKVEVKCFKCIVQGMTSKKIARELGISPRTVEAHTDRIKDKLGVQYKRELIEYFYEHNPRIKFILSV